MKKMEYAYVIFIFSNFENTLPHNCPLLFWQRGNTALIMAACNGNDNILMVLLAAGANVDMVDNVYIIPRVNGEGICFR